MTYFIICSSEEEEKATNQKWNYTYFITPVLSIWAECGCFCEYRNSPPPLSCYEASIGDLLFFSLKETRCISEAIIKTRGWKFPPLSQTTWGKAGAPHEVSERSLAFTIPVKNIKIKINTNRKSQSLFSGC